MLGISKFGVIARLSSGRMKGRKIPFGGGEKWTIAEEEFKRVEEENKKKEKAIRVMRILRESGIMLKEIGDLISPSSKNKETIGKNYLYTGRMPDANNFLKRFEQKKKELIKKARARRRDKRKRKQAAQIIDDLLKDGISNDDLAAIVGAPGTTRKKSLWNAKRSGYVKDVDMFFKKLKESGL